MFLARAGDAVGGGVQREVAAGEDVGGAAGGFAGHGADAGQQLVKGEGLDEIVVGAEVQTLDPVAHGVARGEEEHGRGVAPLAELPHGREAVHARHHDVEDGGVVVGALEVIERLAPVVAGVRGVAPGGQPFADYPVQVPFVLDDKYAHERSHPLEHIFTPIFFHEHIRDILNNTLQKIFCKALSLNSALIKACENKSAVKQYKEETK